MKICNANIMMKLRGAIIGICFILSFFMGAFSANAQQSINVRSGDHPSYSRLVFDWPQTVNYNASLNENVLEVRFDREAVPNFSAVLRDDPTYLNNPDYEISGNELIVRFDANEKGIIRHFRSGTKVVVDIMVNQPITSARDLERNEDVPVVRRAETPRVEVSEPLQDATAENTVENTEVITDNPNDVPANDVDVVASEQAAMNDSVQNSDGLTVEVKSTVDTVTLNYPWNREVKAASFVRGDKLWVIFDEYNSINHRNVERSFDERLKSAEQLQNQTPTILTYTIDPNYSVRMDKTSNGWQVAIRSNFSVPKQPIQIGHQSNSTVGENIFLAASKPGDVINLVDPFVGDEIAIVPITDSSMGIPERRNFTEFNILKTAQGIAIEKIADDLFITNQGVGVAISGNRGLAVSKNMLPEIQLAGDQNGPNLGSAEAGSAKTLIDFDYWGKGPLPREKYTNNRHELLYKLATASDDARNAARWKLAVYDLAHDNAAEAYGILQLIAERDGAYKNNPAYIGALAVSNIKLRRFDEAIKLLSDKKLVAEMDAKLWRSVAYEAIGEYEKALDDFNVGVDILSLQNKDNRAEFLFSSMRAAHALGNYEHMESQLNALANIRLSAKQLTEVDYWNGRVAESKGDEATAANSYDKVIAAGVRHTAALAKFARVNQQYRLKEISAAEAVDALEKLRFAWRGDEFELSLLRQLGDLYIDDHEYRQGLSILKQAATYFPGSAKTSGLTKKMADIYRELYLNGMSENMPPLKAMALFLEFRELTPLGSDGDLMLRNLANRMVSVDLLDDAANLLEHQVKNRLKGVAQADIASNLAKIYVMNKEPEKALKILRATRQPQTPADIEQNRTEVEVRTLIELGQYEEAEVMLEGLAGDTVEELRSDVYWKMENWQQVVDHGKRMLGNRWSDSADLSESERQSVLRVAVALSLNDDESGLENFRDQYIVHMENGLYSDAFEIITAKEQKSGSDIRKLTQTIASVDKLQTFMDSYRRDFAVDSSLN